MEKLAELVKRVRPVLVVFDTLHRCAPGLEENSNKEAGEVFGVFQAIRDATGAAVLVLHHTGHEGKRARARRPWRTTPTTRT